MTDAIVLDKVTKRFGKKLAVDTLDLRVAQGRITGFIGPNGAGKTTTIRMIMAILFPDSGSMQILGRSSAVESKDRIGYLPEERGVYRKMKVAGFLRHMATLKGVNGGNVNKKIADWLERVELGGVEKKKCEELSKGMQQKVQFVASVLHEPELLIFDEPFSGLDPVNMRLLRDLFFAEHKRGATVIFSTHVMHQAEELCNNIVMIHNGVKRLDDPLETIRARYDPQSILLTPPNGSDDAAVQGMLDTLKGTPGVTSTLRSSGAIEAHLATGADTNQVMREMLGRVNASRIEVRRPTLEDIFIEIVRSDPGAGAGSAIDEQALRNALRSDAVLANAPGATDEGGA